MTFVCRCAFTPGGGGGTRVQRGAAPKLRISRKKGSFFKTSACPRFCKRRVLFCTQVRSMGVKIPVQSTNLTPSYSRSDSGLPSLLPPLAAAKQAEDYKNLKLKYVFPFIQLQCFDKRRGVYLVEKISVLLK